MKPVFIIFVLCSLYQTLATASTINYADVDCGISKYSNRSMRVVNGETADKGEFPWVVSLKIGKHHFCGGVLIRNNWILTAAHCFNNREVSEIRIGAGEIARYPNQMEFPTLAVDKLIMHPFYKKEDHTHDIALIRMSGSFTWNELVQPICLSDLHLLLDPKLDEEASHLPSGDFGLLDETDPSSFRFSDMAIINELVNSSLIEAHKPSVDEEKLTLSNIPMSILAALSRLLTGGDDKDETISRTRSTESRAIAPSSSKVISDSIPFHPRNISLSNHLNEVSDSSPLSGMMATIVGWGFTAEKERGGQRSEMLLKVDVPIVANDKCQTWFKEESIKENTKLVVINDARICAGFESGGKDSCLGDSGGPLIVKQKGKYMVIGVVSTGIGCGRPKLPGIYTRVSSYFDWITENLES